MQEHAALASATRLHEQKRCILNPNAPFTSVALNLLALRAPATGRFDRNTPTGRRIWDVCLNPGASPTAPHKRSVGPKTGQSLSCAKTSN